MGRNRNASVIGRSCSAIERSKTPSRNCTWLWPAMRPTCPEQNCTSRAGIVSTSPSQPFSRTSNTTLARTSSSLAAGRVCDRASLARTDRGRPAFGARRGGGQTAADRGDQRSAHGGARADRARGGARRDRARALRAVTTVVRDPGFAEDLAPEAATRLLRPRPACIGLAALQVERVRRAGWTGRTFASKGRPRA